MNIRERREGDVAVIELDGRLTVTDQPGKLRAVVASAIDTGARHVVLDLSGVAYLDSTRLGELIAAHVTTTRKRGRLSLTAVPPRVAELLKLAGLGDVFERFESIDDALRADRS